MSVFRNEWSKDGRKPEGYHHRMSKNLFEEKELDAEWINHLKSFPEKCQDKTGQQAKQEYIDICLAEGSITKTGTHFYPDTHARRDLIHDTDLNPDRISISCSSTVDSVRGL